MFIHYISIYLWNQGEICTKNMLYFCAIQQPQKNLPPRIKLMTLGSAVPFLLDGKDDFVLLFGVFNGFCGAAPRMGDMTDDDVGMVGHPLIPAENGEARRDFFESFRIDCDGGILRFMLWIGAGHIGEDDVPADEREFVLDEGIQHDLGNIIEVSLISDEKAVGAVLGNCAADGIAQGGQDARGCVAASEKAAGHGGCSPFCNLLGSFVSYIIHLLSNNVNCF